MTDYRLLLRHSFAALSLCAVVVVVCYQWVDRPTAFFVDRRHLAQVSLFKWLTYPPPLVQTWSPALLAVLIVRRAWRPWQLWESTFFVALLSLIVADICRSSLGDICGRYWPATWFNDNPSLLGSGAYGFHPFVHGDDIGSFPSGHAARILGFATVWWLALPRSRMLWMVVCPPMLLSLIAMNYHFVGDVIAGSVVGAVVGVYAASLGGLCPGHRGMGQT